MKIISVIGHFGNGKIFLDGQTVKTKIVTEELQSQLGFNNVKKYDTFGGWKTIFKAPYQSFSALKNGKNVIIFPAHNGLRVYVPLLSFFKVVFKRRKLHYVVIGGWLPHFLQEHKYLIKYLKQFDGIYVETNTMKTALNENGFNNVFVMPNCKKLTILKENELVYSQGTPYRLCTFSRVMREKGIEDAVKAVKAVNDDLGYQSFSLDIYGQIDSDQTEWFKKLQASSPQYIRYKGMVPFNQSTEVLKNYNALLFPTYYEGEGFAGTIIDAFAAGLPVIASDWKYNSEIIKQGITGIVIKTHSISELKNAILSIDSDVKTWNSMRRNCIAEAKMYLPENAMKELINIVNE